MGNVRYQIVDGKKITIHKVVFFRCEVHDINWVQSIVEDPRVEWSTSLAYDFVIKNSVTMPEWISQRNMSSNSTLFAYIGEMEEKKLSEYYLKFDKQSN